MLLHAGKRFWLVWLVWLLTFSLNGQVLSLDSCLNMALRNNVAAHNATLEVDAAKQTKQAALTEYFPNINITAGGYYALDPLLTIGISDIPNASIRAVLQTLYAEYGAALGLKNKFGFFQKGVVTGVTATQPVFAGGRIVNGNKLAKIGVEAAELQQQKINRDLLLSTEESYWTVILLQEKLKTVRQVQALLDTLYRDVNGAYSAGLVIQNDVLKVTLKQNELSSTLMKLENGIRLSKMALCQIIGLNYSDNITLIDSITTESISPMIYFKPTETAVTNRVEKQLLDIKVKSEELQHKMILGEALPQVMVGASYSYNNLWLDQNSFNGLVFAVVQVPLTDWWKTGHNLKKQKIKWQIADNERRDLTEKMNLQTQQIWNELEETYKQIDLANATVENASQNLKVATQNYQAGLIPLSDLLEAQTLYRQAVDQQSEELITYQIKLNKYQQLTK